MKSNDFKQLEDYHFELLNDATPILDEVKSHTMQARAAMDLDPVDVNTLANEIVDLAILNQRLGDRVARAGELARASENLYKTVREEHKLKLVREDKVAAGVADSAKMKLSQDEFDLYNASVGIYELLQYQRRACDKTVDAIRSKLSFEKSDYKNA